MGGGRLAHPQPDAGIQGRQRPGFLLATEPQHKRPGFPVQGFDAHRGMAQGYPHTESRSGFQEYWRLVSRPENGATASGPDRSFITFDGKIGYALPDDRRNRQFIRQGKISRATAPFEVSLNEPIRRIVEVDIASSNPLQVCQIEDIAAEKLRALLQQPLRNRHRPQDVLDSCVVARENPGLDLDLTAEFLPEKAKARDVPVSRAAFHQEEIRRRACEGYSELKETTRNAFTGFEEAFTNVSSLVDRLPWPHQTSLIR
jgi:hypothetical protein